MEFEEDFEGSEDFEEEECCDYGTDEFCEHPEIKENNLCTTECESYLCAVEAEADGGTSTWKCSVCDCTDINACMGGCHWVEKTSVAAAPRKRKKRKTQNL